MNSSDMQDHLSRLCIDESMLALALKNLRKLGWGAPFSAPLLGAPKRSGAASQQQKSLLAPVATPNFPLPAVSARSS